MVFPIRLVTTKWWIKTYGFKHIRMNIFEKCITIYFKNVCVMFQCFEISTFFFLMKRNFLKIQNTHHQIEYKSSKKNFNTEFFALKCVSLSYPKVWQSPPKTPRLSPAAILSTSNDHCMVFGTSKSLIKDD